MLALLHNKTAQAVSGWLGLLSFAYVILGKLTPEWVGHLTWPQLILFGIAAALATSFAIAVTMLVGASAYRLIRHARNKVDVDPGADGLNERLSALESNITTASKIIETQVGGWTLHEERIEALVKQLAIEAGERAGDVEKLRANVAALGELNNQNLDFTRRQIASLYDALNAVYQRERLEELSCQIETGAAELRGPTERDEYLSDDDSKWEAWETKQRAWRNILEEWCSLANCYSPGISQKILTVSEDELQQDGKAGLSQFPSIGALMIYRGFNIRYFKWRNWQDEARGKVRKVAIEGTAQSRPIYVGATYAGERDENSRGATLRRIVEGDDGRGSP